MSRNPSDHIFSLDIGTRSVVGMILKQQGDFFSIVDYECAEHRERSMLDGQIHDVSEVSKVIQQVKKHLIQRNGLLEQVSVAAAGRSLKTKRMTLEQSISGYSLLTKDEVLSLELSAIQEAQKQLANDQLETHFRDYYCVGYSVVNYYLDGEIIGNLVDQRGQMAKVEVIATFLPRIVVDSLMTALHKAELQMSTLTLEPIAAINVLIPPSMRRLNIALVDIGAGTSDIAITAEGSIVAYGMVPVAGDEITEALSQVFLLDFNDAEQMKRSLQSHNEVSYRDILGIEYSQKSTDIIVQITDAIDHLVHEISRKILELNGRSPQAVMLIGGGSLTPTLPEKLAQKLHLPIARVAVRGTEAIKNLVMIEDLKGPEFVTPIGIAVGAQSHPVKYLTVRLNGEEVRIFDLKKIHVGDVLLHTGWDIKKVQGRPGMAISVQVNGKVRFIPGTLGTPPTITVNQQLAHLDTVISNQDVIFIEPGIHGEEPKVLIKDLVEEIGTFDIYIDGILYSLPPASVRNGQICQMTDRVSDRDVVEIRFPKTVEEIFQLANLEDKITTKELTVSVNGISKKCVYEKTEILRNGKKVERSQTIIQGDQLMLVPVKMEKPSVRSVVENELCSTSSISVTFNEESLSIPILQTETFINGNPATWDQYVENGDEIVIKVGKPIQPLYHDVFRYSTLELVKPDGAIQMRTLVNGQPADFQTVLHNGDHIELIWE